MLSDMQTRKHITQTEDAGLLAAGLATDLVLDLAFVRLRPRFCFGAFTPLCCGSAVAFCLIHSSGSIPLTAHFRLSYLSEMKFLSLRELIFLSAAVGISLSLHLASQKAFALAFPHFLSTC